MPFFSVIIPLYNKEAHIINTLNSVYNQNFTDYEIIIVNDGSTDNSWNVVKDIENSNIRTFNNKNQGVSETRNFAMKHAKGEYFAFLDADDIWKRNHLHDLNQLINSFPNCGLYCSNYNFDYGNNKIINTRFPTLPKEKEWEGIVTDFFSASLEYRIAWTSAVAIPKKILDTVGFFDINFTSGQDTDYWTRIALKHLVVFTKKVSVNYNTAAENRITNISPNNRNFMTFEKFHEIEKSNKSLKKFNDICRTELAIKHKIIGDIDSYNYYNKDIDYSNINWILVILLKLPSNILSKLWVFKQWLRTKNIDASV